MRLAAWVILWRRQMKIFLQSKYRCSRCALTIIDAILLFRPSTSVWLAQSYLVPTQSLYYITGLEQLLRSWIRGSSDNFWIVSRPKLSRRVWVSGRVFSLSRTWERPISIRPCNMARNQTLRRPVGSPVMAAGKVQSGWLILGGNFQTIFVGREAYGTEDVEVIVCVTVSWWHWDPICQVCLKSN